MVVSIIFYFHPCLGNMSNLTNIFQGGWNHQLEKLCQLKNKKFRIEISKKESKQLFLVESWPPPLWKNQPEVAEKMMTIVFSFSNNVTLKKTLKKTFAATNFGGTCRIIFPLQVWEVFRSGSCRTGIFQTIGFQAPEMFGGAKKTCGVVATQIGDTKSPCAIGDTSSFMVVYSIIIWVVATQISFKVHPEPWGRWFSILTHIFSDGLKPPMCLLCFFWGGRQDQEFNDWCFLF